MALPRVIIILGPTGSGKTDFAVALAGRSLSEGAVLISADSRQIFRGMDIGTAKSDFPHELINIRNPTESYTLADWQHDAKAAIQNALAEKKQPIVVGGTMLYINSLLYNYSLPQVEPNPEFRQKLEQEDTNNLYARLLEKDPEARNFIETHHKQRIIRALEVIEQTGQPFSKLRQKQTPEHDFQVIGLFPGWDELKNRLEKRVQEMLDNGLLEEIKNLKEKYGADLPLLQTMNYRENGNAAEMLSSNMRYAHRQMSWWKKNNQIQWLTDASSISAFLTSFDKTAPDSSSL